MRLQIQPGRRLAGRRLRRALVLSCVILGSGSLTAAAEPIRLSSVDYLGDLPTMVAADQGIFRRHGLDIEVSRSATGKHTLHALRAGETDFALMGVTPLVLNLLKSSPTGAAGDPVIIASLAHSSRLNHVVTLKGKGVGDPSDLAGRRIGLMAGTKAEYLWWMFSILHRIDPESARVVDLPIAALSEALIAGEIDAALLWEPWTSRLKDRVGGDLILLPGADIYIENWLLVTTRGTLQQHPEATRGLLAAYRDAIAFIEASPGPALDIYTDRVGLESQGALTVNDLPLFGLSLDWSLLTALMETSHWARESAKADIDETSSPLTWIESNPLRDVMPLAVGIPGPPASALTARP